MATIEWSAAAADHLRGCSDPTMAALAARFPPVTLDLDLENTRHFHHLVVAIVNQQISGHAGRAVMRRVTALLGDPPSAEAIVGASEQDLRACGLSAAKQRAIRDLAAHALDGRLDLPALTFLTDEEVVARLIAVRGIGRWTAEMFLIFALGRPDVLPVGDYGVRAAVRGSYGLAALPTARELHALAAPWRPYASAATIYLWRSVEGDAAGA